MQLILVILGAVLGSWIADAGEGFFGFVFGGFLGYLLARLDKLRKQYDDLKAQVAMLAAKKKDTIISGEPSSAARPSQRPAAAVEERVRSARETEPPAAAGDIAAHPAATELEAAPRASRATAERAPVTPSFVERTWHFARDWLTSGNVPVKVGVIISFFGVAFLLKYAVENQILIVPIELRLLGVSIGALVMLGVGWRLRERRRNYSLSLQGGGIGILYLTIFAAFRLFGLLPGPFAFLLLVLLTVATGVLAVVQNARALAIFGVVGGFLAPVLTSTGAGNHVALFSYYLLLNGAILGISWYRAWRSLNLLGFLFTFGIGSLWGYRYYGPEHYASTQPFLILYFLFYQAIALLFAFRQPPNLRGLVDGTILFGTPVIAFALQSRLVSDTEYGLAFSAIVLAAFYVGVASWLFARHRAQLKLMTESCAALGIAFATIAIPLALDARWTAAAWSLEGAALVWVGVRQAGLLARLSGALLLFAGGAAFIDNGWQHDVGLTVLNGNALGGLLISAASLFGAYRLREDPAPFRFESWLSALLLIWGVLWWFTTGFLEATDRLGNDSQLDAFLLFAAASAAALAFIARKLHWREAAHTTLGYLPLLLPVALAYLIEHAHWLRGLGWIAWPAALVAHFYLLRLYDNGRTEREGLWHVVGALFFAAGLAGDMWWRLDDASLAAAWSDSAALLVLVAVPLFILSLRERFSWPLARYSTPYLSAAGVLMLAAVTLLAAAGTENTGDPSPLPYLPLLNPYDIVTAVTLLIALRCLQLARGTLESMTAARARLGLGLWFAGAFLLTTIAVLRGVHHLADVPWTGGQLLRSVPAQAALSIYWAMLGFGAMILGARRAQRFVWLVGAALMGVVVVKLFLVDLGNTGTVARIVSFLGVGVLLLVVGYFAPAPPRRQSTAAEASQS